jgi:hypothetical protein
LSDRHDRDQLPGKGLLGWLGRQVGYVKKAVTHGVTHEPRQPLYEQHTVDERPHPDDPSVILRRTTIDQAVKKPDENNR